MSLTLLQAGHLFLPGMVGREEIVIGQSKSIRNQGSGKL